MSKIIKKIAMVGILSLVLVSSSVYAATVTLSDYLIPASPGKSWTYTTNTFTNGMPAGTDFSVTSPFYEGILSLFPDVAETGQVIAFEPNISIYLDVVDTLVVPAGTFNNVLRITWLDSLFSSNIKNIELGINPAINQGVTDVDWFGAGVGALKFMGVMAVDGVIDGGYDLKSYTASSVPESSTILLFSLGLLGLFGSRRKKV